MITVYHGSTFIVEKPLVTIGRKNLDFGQGFYVTRLQEQAKNWALIMQTLRFSDKALINKYEFDWDAVNAEKFNVLSFDIYNSEWLNFIANSRNGKRPWDGYDLIEGGIANDKVIDTVEAYLNRDINVETALGRLAYVKPNNQISILNQSIIDKYLHFVGFDLITEKNSK